MKTDWLFIDISIIGMVLLICAVGFAVNTFTARSHASETAEQGYKKMLTRVEMDDAICYFYAPSSFSCVAKGCK